MSVIYTSPTLYLTNDREIQWFVESEAQHDCIALCAHKIKKRFNLGKAKGIQIELHDRKTIDSVKLVPSCNSNNVLCDGKLEELLPEATESLHNIMRKEELGICLAKVLVDA